MLRPALNKAILCGHTRRNSVVMWENVNGPEGASTPESPGLTCITRSKRGARL